MPRFPYEDTSEYYASQQAASDDDQSTLPETTSVSDSNVDFGNLLLILGYSIIVGWIAALFVPTTILSNYGIHLSRWVIGAFIGGLAATLAILVAIWISSRRNR